MTQKLKYFPSVYILIVFFTIASLQLTAQDSTRIKKVKILPVPAFGFSPETKIYIGAVALFTLNLYDDTLSRSSNAKVEFNYTQMKQIIAETEWNYFFKEEKWFSQGIIHYSKYPDLYYGIGSETDQSGEVTFESDRFKLDLSGLKSIHNKWFAGLGLRYLNYSNIQLNQDSIHFSELKSTDNKGLQLIVLNDKRDNLLTPTKGSYFRFMNSHNIGDKYYNFITADFRKYFSWGKGITQTLSSRLYSQHIFGNAPFYDLALLGGDKFVRGYYYGRFRDNNLTTLQVEYRATLFWRIGLSAFGGVSLIYPSFTSLGNENVKPNAGIGLRFLVDKKEKTNLRFDYAIGMNGQYGFYVSFGESF